MPGAPKRTPQRRRNPALIAARRAKRAGMKRDEYLRVCEKSARQAAKEQGWRPSELAMSLANVKETADTVWPVKPPKGAAAR